MNKIVVAALLLMNTMAYAQIFKCQDNAGKIHYQDKPCTKSFIQTELAVDSFDIEKTKLALKKLRTALQKQKAKEVAEKEQALRERKIRALEDEIHSNKALAKATQENAEAINRNTQAIRKKALRNFYYFPSSNYYRPRPIRPVHHKTKKLFPKTTEIKASILLK